MTFHVIGLGQNPASLTDEARSVIDHAQVIVGGREQLSHFEDHPAKKLPITAPLEAVYSAMMDYQTSGLEVVVVADGDPLFYGIGSSLVDRFGPEDLRFYPNVTTLQTACARVKVPWQDIRAVSLHGRDDYRPLFSAIIKGRWVAVYTDTKNIPSAIAERILEKCGDTHCLWVLEDLDSDKERVRRYSLEEARQKNFSPRNLILLERIREPEIPLGLGTPDDLFIREKGLITKGPARAVGLAALRLRPDSVLWDLGAGCGSLSIEASSIAHEGSVHAVERNANRVGMIRENIRRMGAYLVDVHHGAMPNALSDLPDPDRVFIGGGLSGAPDALLGEVCSRMKPGGRIVAHTVLLDSLTRARRVLDERGWSYTITLIQGGESTPLAGDLRIAGQNPVFALIADMPKD